MAKVLIVSTYENQAACAGKLPKQFGDLQKDIDISIEKFNNSSKHIENTGVQRLLRIIVQNKDTLTTIKDEKKPKKIPIEALCKYSITMSHALTRVKEKTPVADRIRARP